MLAPCAREQRRDIHRRRHPALSRWMRPQASPKQRHEIAMNAVIPNRGGVDARETDFEDESG